MTPQQVVGLGIRLLSIWLAITAFNYFVTIPAALENAQVAGKSGLAYGIAGVYALAALLLWLFPMWTAHKLLPRTGFENVIRLHPLEAARVGCALMGLWIFVQALFDGVWFLFRALLIDGNQSVFNSIGKEGQLDLLVTVVQVVLGLMLVLRAGDFATLAVGDTATQSSDR